MTNKTVFLNNELYQYMLSVSLREPQVLQDLREKTAQDYNLRMQIGSEQGQFMQMLLKLMRAKRTIELGVFTGYSTLATALALPKDGYILACDTNAETTEVARKFWRQAGVEHKIDVRIGPALDTLKEIMAGSEENTYDFAFIDADKSAYDDYYEACLQLIKPGGLIAIDNVFQSGGVIEPENTKQAVKVIKNLNEKILRDQRVDLSIVPIRDGLTLARKK
ncbi:MAG: class I SAM-dependent methyltransferase [Pseudomonadota bacterium]